MIVFARMFARKPVSKTLLVNQIFGVLQAQFSKQTISNWIGLAVEAGILCQSGNAGKSTICLAGEDSKKKPKPDFSGNIALTALGNPYSDSTRHTKKRKPLCRIGEFKLLAPAEDCSVNPVKNLAIELIRMVATGKPALDFAVKTPHRNTLVILLADQSAGEWMQSHIGTFAKGCTFNVECISEPISDGELLRICREKINSLQPDFCFILNLDKVVYDLYTPAQLAKEFAITSKRTGVATIAQTATDKAETLFEFEGSEYWCVKPLVNKYDFKYFSFVGDYRHCLSFHERYMGMLRGLSRCNLSHSMIDDILEDDKTFDYGDVYSLKSKLMEFSKLPDCFVCCNDFVARKVATAIKELGYEIPRDTTIIGFDGVIESEQGDPKITTFNVDKTFLGEEAIRLLVGRIKNRNCPTRIVSVHCRLIERESTIK